MEGLEKYTPNDTGSEDRETPPSPISSAAIRAMQGSITSDKDPETSNIEGVTKESQQGNSVSQPPILENESPHQFFSNETVNSIQGIEQNLEIPDNSSSNQDKKDLVTGLEMMAVLKRSKGDPSAIKWENMERSLSNKPEIPTHVPKYDKYDGHSLSIEEQLQSLGERVRIPKFSSVDGHPLTSEEKLSYIKREYNIE